MGLKRALSLAERALASGGPGGDAALLRLRGVLAEKAAQADNALLAHALEVLAASASASASASAPSSAPVSAPASAPASDVPGACRALARLLETENRNDALLAQLKNGLRPHLAALLQTPPTDFPPTLRALLAELALQEGRTQKARALLASLDAAQWRSVGLGAPLAELCQGIINNGLLGEGASLLRGLSARNLDRAPAQLRLLLGELAWELGERALARRHFTAAAGQGGGAGPLRPVPDGLRPRGLRASGAGPRRAGPR